MSFKRLLVFFAFCFLSTTVFSQTSESKISIIPEPVTLNRMEGYFTLPEEVNIRAAQAPEILHTANFLRGRINSASGKKVSISQGDDHATIRLQKNADEDPVLGQEGYRLAVSGKGIVIRANTAAGLFYGAQTLIQLFPKEIEGEKPATGVRWRVPNVEIIDYPRFSWRGMMFDVSRHYFTKEEVKRFIDNMVKYKYNLLHLHLTDDEGWRIEIKSLPRLTEVGAWRVNKVGQFGTFSQPLPNEPKDYGGFYTQEDIKELIKYASDRFVNILPEIDVPGHSLAAIASYPELSCTPGAEKYNVRAGEPIMDWSRGAPPIALIDNTLCPANEKVYEFLDKVITEVAALFPFEYIHMGGDEAPHNFWQKNPAVKALMQKEGLKTMEEVQGYFTKRVEAIVQAKGKKFIGWDEILDGKPSQSTAVMSWRGVEGGIKAAKLGHEVVMSPSTYAYLDYMQGDVAIEPKVYASLRLNKAYQFDPTGGIAETNKVKGGQANLWTEHIYNMRHAEYMLWPRGLAIAESIWSPLNKKNWTHFYGKVEDHFKRFDVAQMKYAPSMYEPIVLPYLNAENKLVVELSTEIPGLNIHYTFDNSFPDEFYPKYNTALVVPKDAVTLKVITYRDGKPVGRLITFQIADLRSRARKR
ncbi:beta-N-acetylhexosaminidase [Pedobacter sp. SYSU D00535]|uniref:beta-N-acetylhexosaminidase n=1 Tax=Pedobacter sp. SYSU D00535 TaxID=2810308 RepID=UPI001A95A3F9|nr:family 20 glycosylhydrolase [Pedobacter sp. SYSU D00535]